MKVVALAGGTGSAKLLRGLAHLNCELTVVANVGDNIWMYGLYVCPDLDIAMYTLAGVAHRKRGWGIQGDTFEALGQLAKLGEEHWFALGDRDLATHILRTRRLREGRNLTEVTVELCRAYGIRAKILPSTDAQVETRIRTEEGEMNLQEFWVKEKGRPKPTGVHYVGANDARITKSVSGALAKADRVVLCPANPLTSIGPILAIGGLRNALKVTAARVTALSPMVGTAPFSGPAGELMRAVGITTDSVGVAGLYADFLDTIIIHDSDKEMSPTIRRLGVSCRYAKTRMTGPVSERRLAREVLKG